ncbi:MAG: aminotransferase class V-fold PLP-dependent enzyme, partial [Clostridia bacterium]|nr:aminotransferase class V-fold PLP-dependent enzyme [Clostridia bacterium]
VAVSQIGAFAKAVEELPKGSEGVQQAMLLRDKLLQGIGEVGDVVVNSTLEGSPYIINCSVPGIPSDVMIRALEADGVYVSGGSACAKGGRSHVLLAQGVSPRCVDSAVRISFSNHTTVDDVQQFVSAFTKACRILHRKR